MSSLAPCLHPNDCWLYARLFLRTHWWGTTLLFCTVLCVESRLHCTSWSVHRACCLMLLPYNKPHWFSVFYLWTLISIRAISAGLQAWILSPDQFISCYYFWSILKLLVFDVICIIRSFACALQNTPDLTSLSRGLINLVWKCLWVFLFCDFSCMWRFMTMQYGKHPPGTDVSSVCFLSFSGGNLVWRLAVLVGFFSMF
jgi:hypothetical protein